MQDWSYKYGGKRSGRVSAILRASIWLKNQTGSTQKNELPYAIVDEKGTAYMALYETDADLKQNIRDERVAHIGFSIDSFNNIE